MLSGRHVHIEGFESEPGHENEECNHGEHTANRRVVGSIVLVCQTDWLPEAIKLLEEFAIGFLGHVDDQLLIIIIISAAIYLTNLL